MGFPENCPKLYAFCWIIVGVIFLIASVVICFNVYNSSFARKLDKIINSLIIVGAITVLAIPGYRMTKKGIDLWQNTK